MCVACYVDEAAKDKIIAYRAKFSGKYESRVIAGGIGHNLPQEEPEAFAAAVMELIEGRAP